MNNAVWCEETRHPHPNPLQCMHILGENIPRLSHVASVLNGLCLAWRSILLMESKPLSQIQMRCTQLWLVLEKHLSEQRLTEGFLNTRQSQCLTQRRGERCARTAEWKTGQRIMMVISSKPKQSHPLIPNSLSLSLPVCLSPSHLNPLTYSLPSSFPASHSPHIDKAHFFSLCLSYNLKLISHYLRWIPTHTHNF